MPAHPVTHPSGDALRALALGKLEDGAAAALMNHLDGCPDCCKQVAAISGDGFLARLRQARSHSSTSTPVKALSETAGDPKLGPSRPALANIPPELAANQQYEILRELGRGGMGVVYLAKNKLMDRLEVLKVVNKTLLDHPGAVERFLREIRSAAKLSHANVVGAYSAVQQGELLAFAMEYIEGQDLASLVKAQGPLPLPHACYYVQQAANGLQHAFEKGMVHRDIKPQNLILAREGKKHIVKVLDFGLAKVIREKKDDTGLTGEGRMLGTPDYIAPEQTLDAAKADIRADIYSLGCALYYLLSGHPPFSASSLGAILLAHQMHEAKPLNLVRPEVPEELAAVVRKMMAKTPAKRYQTPLEVVQALTPFVKQGTTPKAAPELSVGVVEAKPVVKLAAPVAPPPVPAAEAPKKQPAPAAVWESMTEGDSASVGPKKSAAVRKPRAAAGRSQNSRQKWLIGGGLGLCVLLMALLGMWAGGVFKVKTPDGALVLENLPSDAEVLVDGATVTVTWDKGGNKAEVRVKPGTRKVQVKKGGLTVYGEAVEIEEGGRKVISARWEPLAKDEAKPPRTNDLLPKDSVWRGVGEYTVRGVPGLPPGKYHCSLRITQRTGDQFKGVYQFGDGSRVASLVEGAVGELVGTTGKRKIRWKHVKDVKANYTQRFLIQTEGTIEGTLLEVGFAHGDRKTGRTINSGVITFRRKVKDHLADKPNKELSEQTATPPAKIEIKELPPAKSTGQVRRADGGEVRPKSNEQSPPKPVSPRFVPLFNGKDLTGWKVFGGGTGNWKVVDGAIVSSGPLSHLFSERGDYKNFHFLVEAMIDDGGNSGQYFRAQFGPRFPAGYEAQINSTGRDPIKTGSLYKIVTVTELLHNPNEWFTQEVIAQGDHIVIKVNGKTVVDAHDSRYKKGHFALQQHDSATVVKFRRIEVKELPAKPSPRPAPDELPAEAKEAAREYKKAVADARAKLLAEFDIAIDHLTKKKNAAELRLKLINVLKAEKKRFESSDLVPWSEPMRTHLAYYLARIGAAERKVRGVYNALIVAQVKAKNEKGAAALKTSLSNLIPIRVLAKWRGFTDGTFHHVLVLYSNGKYDEIDGNHTWSYANGVLLCQWPDVKAPRGIGFGKVAVSGDGMTYEGSDHTGKLKFTGVYQNEN